jgi:hypothetical protein
MAFNPFHAFRKHQKVVFAALTIICMLTFVMAGGSFAGGDFFSELTRWVTGRSRVHEVATIYGKRISDRELQELRRQRGLANDFMLQAILQAQETIFMTVQEALPQLDQSLQSQLQQILMQRRFAAFNPSSYLNNLRIYLLQLQFIEKQLSDAKKPAEQIKMIRQMMAALQLDYWLFHTPKDDLYPDANLYFGGSTSTEGILDFLIWRHQADRLGIELTTKDIVQQFKRETLYVLDRPAMQAILMQLQATDQQVLAALGDEFRVRLAQAALVGFDPGGHIDQVPSSVTPYEFWQYYRRNRTDLSLKVLPLPVEKFIPEVSAKPTDAELEALFEKFKEEEYAPSKDTPGFKQPRRLKLEWVSASPDSEYYRNLARHALLSLVAATPASPMLALNLLPPVVNEYETLKWGHLRAAPLTTPDFAYSFYDYSYFQRPENVAALIGRILGSHGLNGSPLSAVVAWQSAAVAREQRDLAAIVAREGQRRLPLSGAALAAGTSVQPILALAGIWQFAGKLDQYLPMDLVKGQLVRKVEENVAGTLLTGSLDAFKTQLETLRKDLERKKTTAADIEKQVDKAVQEHGWAHGGMARLADQYEINRDAKELTPLKEVYMREGRYADPKAKQFAEKLFFNQPVDRSKAYAPYTPQELTSSPSLGSTEKKTFLYWKTEEQPAKVLSFAQAKAQVEAAWRLEKARTLAREKAEELAKQARETHGDALPVLTEASKRYGAVFDLNGVARWVKPPVSSRADPFAPYQPYAVPDDKIEYPPAWPNFVDPLLDGLKEPGDTLVLTNRPRSVFYVAALARRDAPSISDFYKDTTNNRELLLERLEVDRQKDYREALLRQLRDEANLSINEEELQRVKERPNPRAE